jgi:hypothetical protein
MVKGSIEWPQWPQNHVIILSHIMFIVRVTTRSCLVIHLDSNDMTDVLQFFEIVGNGRRRCKLCNGGKKKREYAATTDHSVMSDHLKKHDIMIEAIEEESGGKVNLCLYCLRKGGL